MRPGSGGLAQTRRQMSRRTSGTVRGSKSAARSRSSPPDGVLTHNGQIGVGQHGQRDVTMPSRPGADLVLVEPNLALPRPWRPRSRPQSSSACRRPGQGWRVLCPQARASDKRSAHPASRASAGSRALSASPHERPGTGHKPSHTGEAPWPRRRRSAASSHPRALSWPSPRPAAGQGAAPR